MKKPDIPDNESIRSADLYSLDILDTPSVKWLERTARQHLTTPLVLISLVACGRQWFKSPQG